MLLWFLARKDTLKKFKEMQYMERTSKKWVGLELDTQSDFGNQRLGLVETIIIYA